MYFFFFVFLSMFQFNLVQIHLCSVRPVKWSPICSVVTLLSCALMYNAQCFFLILASSAYACWNQTKIVGEPYPLRDILRVKPYSEHRSISLKFPSPLSHILILKKQLIFQEPYFTSLPSFTFQHSIVHMSIRRLEEMYFKDRKDANYV